MARKCAAALAVLLTVPSFASAFYLPGAAPRDYQAGERIPVNVNRLNPLMNAIDSKIVRPRIQLVVLLTVLNLSLLETELYDQL